jgi:hypothetical protein
MTEEAQAAEAEAAEAVEAEAIEAEAAEKQEDAVQEEPAKKPLAMQDDADDAAAEKAESKPYWPEDWMQKCAEHYGAGDPKATEKELRRIQRISDPAALYGLYREAESRLTSGGLLKVPGEDASEDELAQYRAALGVPEKPEDYAEGLELENGAVIGDADKPMVDAVFDVLHKAGATKDVSHALVNWYFNNQEQQAAQLDEADDAFQRESVASLKEEWGASFNRRRNAIASLFATAPGGAALETQDGHPTLYARLVGGRTADGKVIGDDPDLVRWLSGLSNELNPAATISEDGDLSGKSIDDELAEIKKFRAENKNAYFKDEKMQERYRDLLEAQQRIQARNQAA